MKSVQISVIDEPSFEGGGFARLQILAMAPAKRDKVSLSLRRQSELDPFLGPGGWQSGEHFFSARDVTVEGSDLLLLVGPEVTAHIEDFTTLEVSLPDLAMKGVLVWEGVTPPYDYKAPSPQSNETKEERPEVSPPSDEMSTETEGLDEGDVSPKQAIGGNASFKSSVNGRIKITGTIEYAEDKKSFATLIDKDEDFWNLPYERLRESRQGALALDPGSGEWRITAGRVGKSPLRLFAVLLLVLVIAGGLGAYFWQDLRDGILALFQQDSVEEAQQESVEGEQPGEEASESASAETGDAPGQSGPLCPASPSLGLTDALQKLNEAQGGDPAAKSRLFEEARFLLRCGINVKHGPSMMLYAEQIDSIEFEQGFLTEPDDFQALELYMKACMGGTRVSEERLAEVKEAVENKANQGDSKASQTLLLLWPKVEEACLR